MKEIILLAFFMAYAVCEEKWIAENIIEAGLEDKAIYHWTFSETGNFPSFGVIVNEHQNFITFSAFPPSQCPSLYLCPVKKGKVLNKKFNFKCLGNKLELFPMERKVRFGEETYDYDGVNIGIIQYEMYFNVGDNKRIPLKGWDKNRRILAVSASPTCYKQVTGTDDTFESELVKMLYIGEKPQNFYNLLKKEDSEEKEDILPTIRRSLKDGGLGVIKSRFCIYLEDMNKDITIASVSGEITKDKFPLHSFDDCEWMRVWISKEPFSVEEYMKTSPNQFIDIFPRDLMIFSANSNNPDYLHTRFEFLNEFIFKISPEGVYVNYGPGNKHITHFSVVKGLEKPKYVHLIRPKGCRASTERFLFTPIETKCSVFFKK